MLNYPLDPGLLESRVPRGTKLDTWNDVAFLSLVGFHFRNTRVLGIPIPFHRHFEEVNLRFYVRREIGGETRRGVVFIKELVPRFAIAAVARLLYNENYEALPMTHEVELGDDGTGRVSYRWGTGYSNHITVKALGDGALPTPGSEEEFITEHYWGYVSQRDGTSLEYRVEHPQWRVWAVENPEARCDVRALYGAEFAPALAARPSSAFLADGSPVMVRRGWPLLANGGS